MAERSLLQGAPITNDYGSLVTTVAERAAGVRQKVVGAVQRLGVTPRARIPVHLKMLHLKRVCIVHKISTVYSTIGS